MARLFILILSFIWFCGQPSLAIAADKPDSSPPLTLLTPPSGTQTAQQTPTDNPVLAELQEIYGPVPIAEEINYLLLLAIGLGVLFVAALLFWFFRIRKKPLPPPMPPWELALDQLQQAKSLMDTAGGRHYMDRASRILRDYIESRFAIRSTRQTTEEFIFRLASNRKLQPYKEYLQDFLREADMAKFARHSPSQKTLLALENELGDFIHKTIPVENHQEPEKRP